MSICLIDCICKPYETPLYANPLLKMTIPHYIGKDLPTKCDCGFFIKVNTKLTDTFCPNPYCYVSNTFKVLKVFQEKSISIGMGAALVKSTFLQNNFLRHMDFFTITNINQFPKNYSQEVRKKWLLGLDNIRKNISVSEFVCIFQIDNLGSIKCQHLFSKFSSIDELEDEISSDEDKFLKYISTTLNLNRACKSILDKIKMYLPIFKIYTPYFEFKKASSKNVLFITLTGDFKEFKPRNKLLDWIAENYDLCPIYIKSYSESKTDVLIYEDIASVSMNTKFRDAVRDSKAVDLKTFKSQIEPLRREYK